MYTTSNSQNPRSRHDVVTPGRRREHAQHVSSLKIYFRSRLTAVASRILKSLLWQSGTTQLTIFSFAHKQSKKVKVEATDTIQRNEIERRSALVVLIYESPANPPPTNRELLTFLRHTALLTIVTRLVFFRRWWNTSTAFRLAFK